MNAQRNVVVVGGTNGIGKAVSEFYLQRGDSVTVVGRRPPAERMGAGYRAVAADLSMASGHETAIERIGKDRIDVLLFTAGGLSAKSRVTVEGQDSAWMVNHVARRRLTEALTPQLAQGDRVGFISTRGSYKAPPPPDYEFGVPGRDGMGHVLKTYLPNDALFAQLAEDRPDLHILGYNPGPTKGTALAARPDTPFFVRVLAPLLKLMSRPVGVVAGELLQSLDTAAPGIGWMNAGKAIAPPNHVEMKG